VPGTNTNTGGHEVGARFTSTQTGQIVALRFWKAPADSGVHTGRLWNEAGTQIASVVFTGETHGAEPKAYWGGFAVSKSGLSTLAAVWADELEKAGKPRMNVLIPGPVATPQRRRSHPGEDPAKLRSAEEAARGFLWLLGPDGRGCSGKTVRL